MDAFKLNMNLFDEIPPDENKNKRKIDNQPTSPRKKGKDLSTYALDLFHLMHEPISPTDKYQLIGDLASYLDANLVLPKSDLYPQTNKIGRWLQMIQALFTIYIRFAKIYSKRALRQHVVSKILNELHKGGVEV